MKKIAIPTIGSIVDNHFGHCERYTIITADDNGNIVSTEILPSPQGCGCKSNIAAVFQQIGVTIMLAGGIGEGAINVLKSYGINVIRGCSGDVKILVEQHLKGELIDSGMSCTQHEHHQGEGHSCNH
jgi:predicted Fe-Mo cluster-binding NifX family protein